MRLDKPLSLDFTETLSDAASKMDVTPNKGLDELAQLRMDVQAKNKELDAKKQEINELKIKIRQLEQVNISIQARQAVLEVELSKAESQIELIQELLLENEVQEL